MLHERTCALLNSLSGISNTCILRYPATIVNDESKSIIARADISDCEEPFEPIGLNSKISNLVSIISMFRDPDISRVDNILCIKDQNDAVETQFVTDSVDILSNTEFKNETFDRIVNSLTVASFDLTKDDITKLKKAYSVYNDLSDVIISGDDDIKLSLGSLSKFNKSNNSFTITKNICPNKVFKCAVAFDSLQRIPAVDYNINVKFSERTNAYALVLTNENLHVQIILSVLVR